MRRSKNRNDQEDDMGRYRVSLEINFEDYTATFDREPSDHKIEMRVDSHTLEAGFRRLYDQMPEKTRKALRDAIPIESTE